MDQKLLDFISALDACGDFDAAWTTTTSFFEKQGQPWMCYGYLKPAASAKEAQAAIRTNLPTQILNGWVSDDFYEKDPLYKHVLTSPLPGAFGADYIDRARDGKEVFDYYEGVRSVGAITNVTVPLKNPHGRQRGFLISGGPRKKGEFEKFLKGEGEMLLSAIHYADAHMLSLLEADGLTDAQISPREVETLQWLSEGHMNDRIAEKMKISEVTVRLHLTNIRRKLKSATREQALVKALKLGLISV